MEKNSTHDEQNEDVMDCTKEGADPTAIFALQKHLFSNDNLSDNILETGKDLKAHLRSASLNINGLTQQKLSILLTYIKKKKIDVLTLQDTRLDDSGSSVIAMLIRQHFNNCNIQIRIASVPAAIKRADRVG